MCLIGFIITYRYTLPIYLGLTHNYEHLRSDQGKAVVTCVPLCLARTLPSMKSNIPFLFPFFKTTGSVNDSPYENIFCNK